ncbi:TIGR03086 family protein [Streptomyces sp. AJS327]|uniref:TIGR03086 family metal-binding protein n=1 Tax=Streptomyces sp. AJS327 TaxID=2545265 RepID=UPI0015DED75B|nr:TIGR03086 family metal-binding protein [Streptomyces sp. AJS327]MBA0052563.1 TIGR03086 family protein [Streptomyces sp. AJS327]
MTNELSELMKRAADATAPVVRGVRDDQLTAPTPCESFDVRALLNHVFHGLASFRLLAAGEAVDGGEAPDYLDGDWRDRYEREVRELADSWAAEGALEGTAEAMGIPWHTLAQLVLGDITVHAWDLARATGQEYTPDAGAVEETGTLFARMGPAGVEAQQFAPAVDVPEGADAFTVMIGATGRDPGWTP